MRVALRATTRARANANDATLVRRAAAAGSSAGDVRVGQMRRGGCGLWWRAPRG